MFDDNDDWMQSAGTTTVFIAMFVFGMTSLFGRIHSAFFLVAIGLGVFLNYAPKKAHIPVGFGLVGMLFLAFILDV